MAGLRARTRDLRHRIEQTAAVVRDRLTAHTWSVVQATLAAVIAWTVAGGLVQDHSPFFAPIAAVIALNASGGERGSNALKLLTGVFIGIGAGELALAVDVGELADGDEVWIGKMRFVFRVTGA